ncbi:fluoride efflux transporter CrcB, partial [Vibrio sp. 1866]|nr:fluoride efflux transporter CrcB [Vibrio sp. 1866]
MGQFSILGFIALGGAIGACSRYLVSEFCVLL